MDEDDGDGAAAAAAGEDVHVMFSLMMRDVGGGARCLTSGKVAAAFGRKGDACGYERFVSREYFVEFLKNGDRFAIRCECDSLPEMTMNSLKEGAVLAEDLLIAAGRYNLKDLKSLTENKLCSHVSVSTVLLMLAIAEQYQCCKLKKMCLGFIGSRANAWAIMATNDIENLARSSPSAVKDVIIEILNTRMARSKQMQILLEKHYGKLNTGLY
ncbi:BTB/POZ and MATH domain-containing protein 1-like [Panicum virgatum]|uniref:BTB/POZ and MATH domain-containing protein 1-like n=1 Tax=Panicum virgatum TaxID=38727 RepID=UPI0019D56D40|nr:BTB/POZ and MATH domain-containing protein 1-like [Panicum virgatum]